MNGEIEYGKCDICGAHGVINRMYYHYAIECDCHSPHHFEIVWYCNNCEPKAPEETTITIKPMEGRMNKLPPLKKKCEDCDGDGYYEAIYEGDLTHFPCLKCNGDEEVWNYLSPRAWEEQTGTKLLGSDPVWCRLDKTRSFHLSKLSTGKFAKATARNKRNYQIIVARIGQPAPPTDWRPE